MAYTKPRRTHIINRIVISHWGAMCRQRLPISIYLSVCLSIYIYIYIDCIVSISFYAFFFDFFIGFCLIGEGRWREVQNQRGSSSSEYGPARLE